MRSWNAGVCYHFSASWLSFMLPSTFLTLYNAKVPGPFLDAL
jgi:hypothetical protein